MNFPVEFVAPTLISLSIGILFYALLYMLGNLTSRKEIKGMATESFGDLATVFFYVFLAFFFFSFIENVTPNMLGIDLDVQVKKMNLDFDFSELSNSQLIASNINDLPLLYVGESYLLVMYYQGEKLYRSMLLQVGIMSLMSSIEVGAGIDTLTLFRGFEPFLNLAPTMLTSSSLMLITFSAQYFMLIFFSTLIPTILFPLGILCRVLTPTKSFGGALLALSFTMYFIYPLILSYNFVVAANVLGVDTLVLDSVIYNAPECNSNSECNSNKCVPVGSSQNQKSFCQPCILQGSVPKSAGADLCCAKTSKYDASKNECVLSFDVFEELNIQDTNKDNIKDLIESSSAKFGKGGIISSSGNIQNIAPTALFATIGFFIFLTVFSIMGVGAAVTGFLLGGLSVIGMFAATFGGGLLLHPLMTFIYIFLLNSKFFFVGFILPAIEFIIIIEFIRVFTGSMGESIDIMDIFKVI